MNQFHLDEEAIFDFASRIDSPELRAEYVNQACGTNSELKNPIAELLTAFDQERDFLERPPKEFAPTVTGPISEKPGDSIGPYKLLQQIGEGGFGVVYMAEQLRPVKRKVALKIIKPGMDTKEIVARFEAERQALALMDHPNIAKVFDGGATETGRPYFVMELVKGVPITEFCDSNKLPTRQRLELFGHVCQAIQHAHQKGVIHRDIKPSNVMVTLHDNQPVPKVIDFGVAKAISQELTEKTMFTSYGQMIGTPQYMSPEQAQMSGLDIDTRSDVYSLGVLLYELLTGTTPLDIKQLRNSAYAELQRLICESEPQKPSTKVTGLGRLSVEIASNRGVDARKLNLQLRGDLDWIVMKALEKDRNRRFESAGSLAGDVERYLSDQPILARPPSTMYQLRKFFHRNRHKVYAFAATAATAILLCAAIVLTVKLHQEKERRAAEQRQLEQQQAIDAALEAFQNVDLAAAERAIKKAEAAEAKGMLMDILNGRLRLARDDWEGAIRLFEKAGRDFPKSVSPPANLVRAYADVHQVDKYLDLTKKLDDYKAETSYDYLFKAEAQATGSWGDYRKPLATIQHAIDLAMQNEENSPAPYILQAKILVRQAAVTGEEELIKNAFKDIDAVSRFARDKNTIVRLQFATHLEAAHTLRSIGQVQAADEHYAEAKRLLDRNPILREPRRDLALILFYEYTGDDEAVFQQWKKMVIDGKAVGGVAGMYGMCAICQGKAALDDALEQLLQIDKTHGTADLSTQLGIMAVHAGDRRLAKQQYDRANAAESPLVRLDAQWTALLLGDRESVARCCRELREEGNLTSRYEKQSWDILSRRVTRCEDVLSTAGDDRKMASLGLVSLGLTQLADGWTTQARESLEKAVEKNGLYFGAYVAKGVLYELDRNPDWPRDAGAAATSVEAGTLDDENEVRQTQLAQVRQRQPNLQNLKVFFAQLLS